MIVKSPQTVSAELYDQVNLKCKATGDPPISYHWRRDGLSLSEQLTQHLVIPKVSPKDRGSYVCIATNPRGNSSSEPALVTIKGE